MPATLTATVHGSKPVRRAVVTWGRQWPAVVTPNVKPAPGPVIVRRATTYSVLVSGNGSHWRLLTTSHRRDGDDRHADVPAPEDQV